MREARAARSAQVSVDSNSYRADSDPFPRMKLHLALLATLAPGTHALQVAGDDPFPASTALAEGVSPDALAALDALVRKLVDDDEVVGAELLVLEHGRSILHEAYGFGDREAQKPMEVGSVFCVRSMTKPVVGAAIWMLIDEKVIALDDPVARYLPSFDVEGSRDITIEHLLTHTSGLPMSLILGKDPRTLESIRAVAELGAGYALDFAPGTAISYSDQGTDTLTALIEVVSGMPVAEFVRTRVLDPLGMQDSTCVLTEDSPLRSRALVKYAGSRGAWTRFWGPDEPPLFPIFLGSQGLYSTLEDYARFMRMWERKGRGPDGRLIASRSVRKALTPSEFPFPSATGLPGLSTSYGALMQLWTREHDGEREVVAFGHTGSDGTHAWVFPEQDAMVLYFTQSRQNPTGLRVEEALATLFLGAPFDANEVAPPFDDYLGYYWEGEGDLYRAIIRDGDDLALEILGKGIVPLTYVGDDRWKFRPNPSIVLAFQRAGDGAVTGYSIGDHHEFRFEPGADLPRAEDVAARVAAFHRVDLFESLGPVRFTGALTIEKLGITGETSTTVAWPNRWRIDTVAGDQSERVAFDGEHAHTSSSAKPVATLDADRSELMRFDGMLVAFGDWRRWYPDARVIQTLEEGQAIVVRTGGTSAPARTLFVAAESGRVLREMSTTFVDGMGRVGQRLTYGDFRDVAGMQLPFRTETVLANPLIGAIVTTTTGFELGVEVPEGAFELRD